MLGLWLPSTLSSPESDGNGKGLYIAFVLTFSTFASPYVSLFPTSLIELFGTQNFASVNGFFYLLRGVGALVGTPVAGALIPRNAQGAVGLPSDYTNCAAFNGSLLAVATVCVFWARLESVGLGKWRA